MKLKGIGILIFISLMFWMCQFVFADNMNEVPRRTGSVYNPDEITFATPSDAQKPGVVLSDNNVDVASILSQNMQKIPEKTELRPISTTSEIYIQKYEFIPKDDLRRIFYIVDTSSGTDALKRVEGEVNKQIDFVVAEWDELEKKEKEIIKAANEENAKKPDGLEKRNFNVNELEEVKQLEKEIEIKKETRNEYGRALFDAMNIILEKAKNPSDALIDCYNNMLERKRNLFNWAGI